MSTATPRLMGFHLHFTALASGLPSSVPMHRLAGTRTHWGLARGAPHVHHKGGPNWVRRSPTATRIWAVTC
jgi:hypothetical protein